ncbi:MAG: di-heme oxidoredictase family protein [Pseudomonadota bacterium]
MVALWANCAFAIPVEEPHLNIIPRSAAEQARIDAVRKPPTDFSKPQPFEDRPAGAATVRTRKDEKAFSLPSAQLDENQELDFIVGRALFKKLWVSSPSSNLASDGLGPLFNARSCLRCHLENGRGHPPELHEDNTTSMVFRVSVPGGEDVSMAEIADYIHASPDPVYGEQLQDLAIQGHRAEAQVEITYEEFEVTLSEGEVVHLRRPTYAVGNFGYGPLQADAMISPRVAPQMIGLGLLEAIPARDIHANADPDDLDRDGVSGRANIVWSREFNQPMLGRFGLKAGMPTMREQTAAAFSGDIGISSPILPEGWGECTNEQDGCRTAVHGDKDVRVFEIDGQALDLVSFYSSNLGVPGRRSLDAPDVLRGKEMFYAAGCNSCHTPSFVTHRLKDDPERSFQLIWPYTDLLLHDMGEGLADNRPEARASGREWRTPPLWGIGLTQRVSGHTYFLHDGRARSLLEAILWHGGEAQKHRDHVVQMPSSDRAALIKFLESL